jgi:hypothetical protein
VPARGLPSGRHAHANAGVCRPHLQMQACAHGLRTHAMCASGVRPHAVPASVSAPLWADAVSAPL